MIRPLLAAVLGASPTGGAKEIGAHHSQQTMTRMQNSLAGGHRGFAHTICAILF